MTRHTGYAHLPLHQGRAPAWLLTRMTGLAREIAVYIVADQRAEQLLRRLSDPFWFRAFGCVLGFDWHSSGVTTADYRGTLGGFVGNRPRAGAFCPRRQGATSRKTPGEIVARCDLLSINPAPLVYAGRVAEKVGQRRGPGRVPASSPRVLLYATPASTRDPRVLRVRPRRQGRDPVPRRSRLDDRRPASRDGAREGGSIRESGCVRAARTVREGVWHCSKTPGVTSTGETQA